MADTTGRVAMMVRAARSIMLKSWAGLRAMYHAAECHNPW